MEINLAASAETIGTAAAQLGAAFQKLETTTKAMSDALVSYEDETEGAEKLLNQLGATIFAQAKKFPEVKRPAGAGKDGGLFKLPDLNYKALIKDGNKVLGTMKKFSGEAAGFDTAMKHVGETVSGIGSGEELEQMGFAIRESARAAGMSGKEFAVLVSRMGEMGFAKDQAVEAANAAVAMGSAMGMSADKAAAQMQKYGREMNASAGQVLAYAETVTAAQRRQEGFVDSSRTIAASMARVRASISDVRLTIGSALAPAMQTMSAVMQEVTDKVNEGTRIAAGKVGDAMSFAADAVAGAAADFTQAHPKITAAMGYVAVGSQALKVGIGQAGETIKDLREKWGMLRNVWLADTPVMNTVRSGLSKGIAFGADAARKGFLGLTAAWNRGRAVLGSLNLGLAGQKAALLGSAIAQKAVTAGTWLFSAALWANPIVWIVGGVIALGAAAYMLVKHWDKVAGFFSGLWGFISAPIQAIGSAVKGLFSFDLFETGKDLISGFVGGIVSMAAAPFKAVKSIFGFVRKLLPFSGSAEGPLSGLDKAGSSMMGSVAKGAESAGPAVGSAMGGALSFAKKALGAAFSFSPLGLGVMAGKAVGGLFGKLFVGSSDAKEAAANPAPAGNPAGAQGVVINFNPNIQISGGASAETADQITACLKAGESRLRELIREVLSGEDRLAYT